MTEYCDETNEFSSSLDLELPMLADPVRGRC